MINTSNSTILEAIEKANLNTQTGVWTAEDTGSSTAGVAQFRAAIADVHSMLTEEDEKITKILK